MAAQAQLAIFTEGLTEKTQLIEALQSRLSEREFSAEQAEYIRELSRHYILTDEDWDRFRDLFGRVYPGFFARLRQDVPDITLAEMRMAALCKLQIQARDAAGLLGISPNSVHKTRQRLRQRLGLSPETDLEAYFSDYG
jgi:DNA-binding CsgD family transcriptional regulator